MAKLTTCENCGKLFGAIAGETECVLCRVNTYQDCRIIEAFVSANPRADITAIVEETGISRQFVEEKVIEGLVQLHGDHGKIGYCATEGCNNAVVNAKFCGSCRDNIAEALRNELKPPGKQICKTCGSLHEEHVNGRGMHTRR